ncbi:hypothetical protein [Actinoplanes couchii]|uniref:DUF4267 domain-containing protein n=1 Tax=Actinoplanes couchii TaxID=403638 RepID=A0ABQ3XKB1_9ACTN|nr:hypothetical protein [Actinoplanes couchii]MDR6320532.1 hypothetical protein [Actinoplanes couchii]GID58936.1 hypothetical protein Aco03nite_073400 [Actinoplanes couchii]
MTAPTRFTRPLQNLVVACSLAFVIGTALQAFVIIDEQAIFDIMRTAGASPEQAATDAPGFLLGFRAVGCVYLLGNMVGLLARTGRPAVFWTVLAVNLTQAAGVVVIPPEVFEVTLTRFGPAGLLPSYLTDGGAALLTLLLLTSLARFRTPWAHQ